MARRGRRRRSRSTRNATRDASVNPQLQRIWSHAIQAQNIGILFGVAGLTLVLTPLLRRPDDASSALVAGSWWTSAFYAPDVLGLAAALVGLALVMMLGMLWVRVEFAGRALKKESDPTEAPAADFTLARAPIPATIHDLVESSRANTLTWVGAACMVAGVGLLAGDWFYSQQKLPPAYVAIANGEVIQNYSVPLAKAPLTANLPRRVRLKDLQLGAEPTASIQIFRVGDAPDAPPSIVRTLPAGTGVNFDGLRITFSGVRASDDKLRAIFSSEAPKSVPAVASISNKFRVSLDGPEYKLLDVRKNYLSVMGPAAEIESSELGKFWVFERTSHTSVSPDLGHPIQLDRVESEMAGIFTLTTVQPFWPISLGGTLFVLGFALLIIFPERIVRTNKDDGGIRIWSFHEAGKLADHIVDETMVDDTVDQTSIKHAIADEEPDAVEAPEATKSESSDPESNGDSP